MNIDGRSILLALIPIGLTLVNYAIIRDLLWGILLGNKSKKSAEKHRAEAEGWQKFSQRYIGQYLTKYQKDYTKWMNIKVATAVLTIVQIIGFALAIIIGVPFWVVAITCGVIILANIVLFIIMMNKTESSTNKKSTKGSPWKFEQ